MAGAAACYCRLAARTTSSDKLCSVVYMLDKTSVTAVLLVGYQVINSLHDTAIPTFYWHYNRTKDGNDG